MSYNFLVESIIGKNIELQTDTDNSEKINNRPITDNCNTSRCNTNNGCHTNSCHTSSCLIQTYGCRNRDDDIDIEEKESISPRM